MRRVLLVGGLSFVAIFFIFIFCLLGAAMGAFVGWIISMTFLGDWLSSGFELFGIHVRGHLVELGTMLGFLSGFFKTRISSK